MKPMHTKPEKIYVKVDSTFDATGYMQPTSITWADGRTFPIEKVRDFRPAGTADNSCSGDCFTVLMCSTSEKFLKYTCSPCISNTFFQRSTVCNFSISRSLFIVATGNL